MTDKHIDAWNAFVMNCKPEDFDVESEMRSAALAKMYMNMANNGGINWFLTYSYDFDTSEILSALRSVGAFVAAEQLGYVVEQFGGTLPASSEETRWKLLEIAWSEVLDRHDLLSHEADAELMKVLEEHVSRHQDFYLARAK